MVKKESTKPRPKALSANAEGVTGRTKAIIHFLKTHPLISVHGLCKIVGIANSTFRDIMQLNGKRPIPPKYFPAMQKELMRYGFKKAVIKKHNK